MDDGGPFDVVAFRSCRPMRTMCPACDECVEGPAIGRGVRAGWASGRRQSQSQSQAHLGYGF